MCFSKINNFQFFRDCLKNYFFNFQFLLIIFIFRTAFRQGLRFPRSWTPLPQNSGTPVPVLSLSHHSTLPTHSGPRTLPSLLLTSIKRERGRSGGGGDFFICVLHKRFFALCVDFWDFTAICMVDRHEFPPLLALIFSPFPSSPPQNNVGNWQMC